MNPYWSDIVQRLTPYVPGEQPRETGIIKLNTNENPYPPAPEVLAAISAATNADLRLYPDPAATSLREAIAVADGVAPAQVFVGNGSDEVLAHVFQALLKHDAPLLYPDITYSFYPVYCDLYGIDRVEIPLTADYRIDLADYDRRNGGIIFPNPNAPTGTALPRAQIESLLQLNTQSVVVVDEAYVAFGAETLAPLVTRYPNLLVVRTLSKSLSLAGLRVGYALGDAGLLEALERVKGSFNSYPLDRLALAGATAAMRCREYYDAANRQVMASREKLVAALGALGFEVLPSAANFVFARHPGHAGAALQQALRARNVLVRHFAKPRIADFLRITIGTEDQCAALVAALNDVLG
ncbi:MAG: histidinol-phosphate transaminase [Gammaproteobacteria bacterium]|nr:histidinol-phosphate transaminase [Gammaproteobacteria bacterium]